MKVLKCKMCGGNLDCSNSKSVVTCEYCGTSQTFPLSHDEEIQNMYTKADELRRRCEFDKAEKLYERILFSGDAEAETYWGALLCEYGVEYVKDPLTSKMIPTCHRVSYESVTSSNYYREAIFRADFAQKELYEQQAQELETIQKEIIKISEREEPYDVFICYKETDENGERTQDSVIANDLYYELTQEGFKVFYAAISLEDKLGQEYEPIIFAALHSAKVMLVLGTKEEYFESVWVKNEWSRFLKIIKKDRSKKLIPCYRDMDAYNLPDEFAHLQAQDMSKIGFVNNVVRGINQIIDKEALDEVNSDRKSSLLKRAFIFLEDSDFRSADEYCEKALDENPENAEAYLAKLMITYRVKKREDLGKLRVGFEDNVNYKRILRYGNDEIISEVKKYLEEIRARVAYNTEKEQNNYSIKNVDAINETQDKKISNELKNVVENPKELPKLIICIILLVFNPFIGIIALIAWYGSYKKKNNDNFRVKINKQTPNSSQDISLNKNYDALGMKNFIIIREDDNQYDRCVVKMILEAANKYKIHSRKFKRSYLLANNKNSKLILNSDEYYITFECQGFKEKSIMINLNEDKTIKVCLEDGEITIK